MKKEVVKLIEFWKKSKNYLQLLFCLIVFYSILYACGITCIFKFFFGVSCPGCGMTRACISALRLDFSAAFSYHPLWVALLPVLALLLYFHLCNKKTAYHILLTASAVALIAVYFYRLRQPDCSIVVFHPQQGYFYKFVSFIASSVRASESSCF